MKAPMRPGESENILRDPERDDGRRKRRKRNATLNETDRLRADLKQATVVVRLYLETIDNKPRTKPGRVDKTGYPHSALHPNDDQTWCATCRNNHTKGAAR